MPPKKPSKWKNRIREMVPCIFALLIFIVPLIVYVVVFPTVGPIIALLAGVGTYLIILGICIIIWWRGRVTE
jgi:hypothetical protein